MITETEERKGEEREKVEWQKEIETKNKKKGEIPKREKEKKESI